MLGFMQQVPLLLSSLLQHAARFHPEVEIVSRSVEGPLHRTSYDGLARRAARLAHAIERLGVRPGDRVATLAWNGFRHMELYFGVTGAGGILHTINPRLFPDQIEYIVSHAEDGYVFLDLTFLPTVERLAPRLPDVRGYVLLTDQAHVPATTLANVLCYEDLLAPESETYDWPRLDENSAAILCYTSGTTGAPKGVLYSHRSLVLHSYCCVSSDGMALSARDSVLLVTPLFHVNAWGVPFAAAMCGAKLVLPGAQLDGESLFTLMCDEGCTFSLGVPTVWMTFLDYVERNAAALDLSRVRLERVLIGGSAVPRAVIEKFDRLFATFVMHAWGATEMSPLVTVCNLLARHRDIDRAAQYDIQERQGRPLFGVELKITDATGADLPHDGVAVGEFKVRGAWVLERYYRADHTALDADGWFATGDVGTIDPDGYALITDRIKDVIKSGGEWISSIALENAAVGHPAVQEAAVIAIPHEKWQERPLLLVRLRGDMSATREDILAYLAQHVAKWWLPDDVVFVAELPHTATGKLLKTKLREMYARGRQLPPA